MEPDAVTLPKPPAERRLPRVFVGLKVASEIARELAMLARPLDRFPVRLVAVADIHLTLVPPWDEPSVPDAIEKLRLVAGRSSVFPLAFHHVAYGPHPRRPRLLWAECTTTDEIVAFQSALVEAYGQRNERPFRPHVTLARIRGNGAIVARKCPLQQDLSLTQQVESVELFQSPPPGASGYQVLASLRLGKESAPHPPDRG